MYQHSSTRIKLIDKVSDAIDVTIGTEQGHPMSPELFKMFVHDLSTELELLLGINIPDLNNYKISHLLWADDLILIAEDAESLQKLLDVLYDYIYRWELEINLTKTNIMVFNPSSRLLNCSFGFRLGKEIIQPTKSYTYLGITFSLNGSFNPAIENLSKKASRSYFSMKRTVDITALSTSSLLNLFDCLIKPIATYCCQIWLPSTNIIKALLKEGNLMQACTKDKLELAHLKMLKWMFGVHKKTSNVFCLGDSGRVPIALSVISRGIKYYRRLEAPNSNENCPLVKHAFQEQRINKFEWYKTWSFIDSMGYDDTPLYIQELITNKFIADWNTTKGSQRKLEFYDSIKHAFEEEAYLNNTNHSTRNYIARIRSSSHDLNIERGRYVKNNKILDRLCRFCCNNGKQTREILLHSENLPFYEPILETECHMITVCPAYHHLRINLSEDLKILVVQQDYFTIMNNPSFTNEFGYYLQNCYKVRHPKKDQFSTT